MGFILYFLISTITRYIDVNTLLRVLYKLDWKCLKLNCSIKHKLLIFTKRNFHNFTTTLNINSRFTYVVDKKKILKAFLVPLPSKTDPFAVIHEKYARSDEINWSFFWVQEDIKQQISKWLQLSFYKGP